MWFEDGGRETIEVRDSEGRYLFATRSFEGWKVNGMEEEGR